MRMRVRRQCVRLLCAVTLGVLVLLVILDGFLALHGHTGVLRSSRVRSSADDVMRLSHAQFGQERFVFEHYRDMVPHTFVEFGCRDGVEHSNTFALEMVDGWRGLCVEAIESVRGVRALRYQGAICAPEMQGQSITFATSLPGLHGSIDSVNFSSHNAGQLVRTADVAVRCLSLPALLRANNIAHVGYMSVDVEGGELGFLRHFDFAAFRTDVLQVECNAPELCAKTQALLETEAYGFRLVHRFAFGALGQGAGPRGGADLLFENVALQPERAPRTVRAAAAQGAVLRQGGDFLRGVSPALRARYQVGRVGGQATFTCLDGRATALSPLPATYLRRRDSFPQSAVNDEYCDCADGSDEPGTSACASVRGATQFYCGWEQDSEDAAAAAGTDRSLFLSRVNDGICDCCDGADEWRHGAKPCPNSCGAAIVQHQSLLKKRAAGQAERAKMVKQARALKAGSRPSWVDQGLDGGPDSAFLPLSDECLDLTVVDSYGVEYIYTVCPWKSVTQRKGEGGSIEIASGPWAKKKEDSDSESTAWLKGHYGTRLQMGGGEFCPPISAKRRAILVFECGLVNKIKHVEEFETCVYTFKVETPAACV